MLKFFRIPSFFSPKKAQGEDFGQRAFWKRAGLALVLFLVCYALLYGIYWGKTRFDNAVANLLQELAKKQIVVQNPQIHMLSLTFDKAYYQKASDMVLENGSIDLSLWNKEIHISADIAKGKIKAEIKADALFNPQKITVSAILSNMQLEEIKNSLPLQAFVSIDKGLVNISADYECSLMNFKPQLNTGKGKAVCEITDTDITHYIPILNKSKIKQARCKTELHINKNDVHYAMADLSSDILKAQFKGNAKINFSDMLSSTMNINGTVQVDKNDINQDLTPQNTRRAILEKNEVQINITGSLRKPTTKIL